MVTSTAAISISGRRKGTQPVPRPSGTYGEHGGCGSPGPAPLPQLRDDSLSRVLTLPPVPRAVAAARHWARQTLTRWRLASLAEPTEHLVSELVTNSIEHADDGASVVVLLMYAAGTMRLEVRDHDPLNVPLLKKPAPTDIGGRGLVIVQALSDRWGIRITDSGKTVWCELGVPIVRSRDRRSPSGGGAGHGA
jgi:anti-sigma regulatory factor (Ser/Thr protein kinase)